MSLIGRERVAMALHLTLGSPWADPHWSTGADQVTATALLRAYKRGGVLVPQN